MLNEYKQIYKDNADLLDENWSALSKSELANLYIANKGTPKAEYYLSALICKYWNMINSIYYKQGLKQATEEYCYNIVVESILNALDKHAWTEPTCSVYNDKKGPEKIITKCIMCTRANFYQAINYDMRIVNYTSNSLEAMQEDLSDGLLLKTDSLKFDFTGHFVHDYIKSKFEQCEYFIAILMDLLYNINYSNNMGIDFKSDLRKILRAISMLDDTYINYFAKEYELNKNEVTTAVKMIKDIKRKDVIYIKDCIKKDLSEHPELIRS